MISGQPSYRCLDCLDTGIVNIFNPAFLWAYRPEFDELPIPRPKGWFGQAYSWWQRHRGANDGMEHVALCDCGCERAVILEDELQKFERGERKMRGKGRGKEPASPPACGRHRWHRQDCPRVPDSLSAPGVLIHWFARRIA